jgi:uncharacterized protein YdcH (DUF465 family)
MIESEARIIETLIEENDTFKEIYKKHRDLDKQVTKAHLGNIQLSDLELNRLKKEKLFMKERLVTMIEEYQQHTA